MIEKPHVSEEEIDPRDEIKIFYCSRTHSQLTQFANEIRRVKFPTSVAQERVHGTEVSLGEEIKHLALGSRKNLCINSQVSRLSSTVAINERCLELQKPKISSNQKCAFLPNKENESLVNEFRDHALAKVRDIEDLGLLGKKLGICPYYASRAVIKPSEVSLIKTLIQDYTETAKDYYVALSVATTERCTRSLGHLFEGPHRDHRRSTQPHGCYIVYLLHLRYSHSAPELPSSDWCLSSEV